MIMTGSKKPIAFHHFPNGETVWDGEAVLDALHHNLSRPINEQFHPESYQIFFRYESDADLIQLMFLKAYLDERGWGEKMILCLLHMPYARMDRSEGITGLTTLKHVARMINDMKWKKVVVYEPHSDVTMALLDRSVAVFPTVEKINNAIVAASLSKDGYIYFPDAGASKRYGDKISKLAKGNHRELMGSKHRDFATGELSADVTISGLMNPDQPRDVLIVDDLCSRGGTFINAAKALRGAGAERVSLFVTHCEKNIMTGSVFTTDLIDKVITTNTMIDEPLHDKMEIIKVW